MTAVDIREERQRLDEPNERHTQCPYLRRAKETTWYPIEGYCVALTDHALRVVTISEFNELCTTSAHVQCERYRERHEAPAEGAG